MSRPPMPQEGQRPYQYRFSPRNLGADLVRSFLGAPINAIDRFTGGNIRYGTDRLFGGVNDRMYNDEAAYMRNMMNQDARAMQPGLFDRLRQAFGRGDRGRPPMPGDSAETFGLGEDTPPANPAWVDEWVRNGSAPLPRGPQPGMQSRIGAGRGTTIASRGSDTSGRNPAADMLEGMRSGLNSRQSSMQARRAMDDMFGDQFR